MITGFQVWWHRAIFGHYQESVMNGATEPGVWCWCRRRAIEHGLGPRWFPSDGGGGK